MPDTTNDVRVRIAPSPTGALHIGTARTALFNYLFARHHEGKFFLRIEDTDPDRSEKKWEDDITEGLRWLGMAWDGDPLHQSARTDVYRKQLEKLLAEKKAFFCWHTRDELQKEQAQQTERKEAPRHVCDYRDEDISADKEKQKNAIIRFKNPSVLTSATPISFTDMVRGEVTFDTSIVGDFSLAKGLDSPLYNFAVVVDDADTGITHVIRGEDHISNTPKQLLLQEALGFRRPNYAHIPLILGPDRSKLSKRHGATSILEYRDLGYLPDALFNFLALLGWHPQDDTLEILPREEIVTQFDIRDVRTSGAIFDIEKLNWMNGEYIRAMALPELTHACKPYFERAGFGGRSDEELQKIVALEQARIHKLSEITEATEFIFKDISYKSALLAWKDMQPDEVRDALTTLIAIIENTPDADFTARALEKVIMPEAEKMGSRGELLWPLRVALSGRKHSPGPFEIMEVLKKNKSLTRVREALDSVG